MAGDSAECAHQLKTMKYTDVLRLRTGGNERHHVLAVGLGNDPRRVLRVDEHHIGPARLEPRETFMQLARMRRQRTVAQHRVRADLPEHEVGMLGDDRLSSRASMSVISSPLTPRSTP